MNGLRKYIVSSVLFIQCCFAEMTINSIDDLKHFIVNFDLKLHIGSKIYAPKLKTSWFVNEKYKDTFFNVIPTAIADCITQRGVFAKDKLENNMIVFNGTDPKQYTRANWNAVVFYNYIKKCYDKIFPAVSPAGLLSHDDIFNKELKQDLIKLYSNYEKEIERSYYEINEHYDKFLHVLLIMQCYVNEFKQCNGKWAGYNSCVLYQNSEGIIDGTIYLNAKNLNHVFNLGNSNKFFVFIQNGKTSNLIKQSTIELTKNVEYTNALETTEILLDDYLKPIKTQNNSKIMICERQTTTEYTNSEMTWIYTVNTPIVKFKCNGNEDIRYECEHLRKYYATDLTKKIKIIYLMRQELIDLMMNKKWINQDFVYDIAMSVCNYLVEKYRDFKFISSQSVTLITLGTRSFVHKDQLVKRLSKLPILPDDFF